MPKDRFTKFNISIPVKEVRNLLTMLIFIALLYLVDSIFFQAQSIWLVHLGLLTSPVQYYLGIITFFISLFLLALFLYAVQLSPGWMKLPLIVYFSGAVLVEYGYYGAVHRPINPSDLQMGLNAPLDMWVDATHLFFKWESLIPIFVLILFLFISDGVRKNQTNIKRSLLIMGIWLACIGGMSLIPEHPIPFINWGSASIQLAGAVFKFTVSNLSKPEREQLVFRSNTRPQNNIVLIVDESISADHLSINGYEFETTPYLDTLAEDKSLFHNWGVAVTGATCSESANVLLITGVKTTDKNLELPYQYPTVFQYAKAMGYTTHYFDAQCSSLWNGISNQDLLYLDEWVNTRDVGDYMDSDFLIADKIRKIVSTSVGNFILVNKKGAHWVYERDYPPEATVWSPVSYINIYNNAVRYNVNTFFERLIPKHDYNEGGLHNTVYIYTSDHSESLFLNGETSGHCGASLLETRVPMFIIGKLDRQVDTSYLASHSNILPTVLDLMNYPMSARPHQFNFSLLIAESKNAADRFFFVGFTDEVKNYETMVKEIGSSSSNNKH